MASDLRGKVVQTPRGRSGTTQNMIPYHIWYFQPYLRRVRAESLHRVWYTAYTRTLYIGRGILHTNCRPDCDLGESVKTPLHFAKLLQDKSRWRSTQLQEGRKLRTNRGHKSNFDIPCKEAAYLTRTVIYTLTPPNTTGKRGKLTTVTGRVTDTPSRRGKLTRVSGRVLPALQLYREGKSTNYFLHKNTPPLSHSGQSEGNAPLTIVSRVLQSKPMIPSHPAQLWLHRQRKYWPRQHHILFVDASFSDCTTLLCPIITGLVILLIFPPAGVKLLGYHSKSRRTFLHHQHRALLHCHQLRKKKSTDATLAAVSELMTKKKSTDATLDAMSKMKTQLTISSTDVTLDAISKMIAILQGQVNARAAVAPVTSYTRTPAFSGQYDLLDFCKKVGVGVYNEGRIPVLEGDNCFDLKPDTLGQFLSKLELKATDHGWNNEGCSTSLTTAPLPQSASPSSMAALKWLHSEHSVNDS
jgi:hypothetical protein